MKSLLHSAQVAWARCIALAILQFAAPKPLFKTRTMSLEGAVFREYDVSPDGQRFLIGTLVADTKAAPPTVILNWTALLKK